MSLEISINPDGFPKLTVEQKGAITGHLGERSHKNANHLKEESAEKPFTLTERLLRRSNFGPKQAEAEEAREDAEDALRIKAMGYSDNPLDQELLNLLEWYKDAEEYLTPLRNDIMRLYTILEPLKDHGFKIVEGNDNARVKLDEPNWTKVKGVKRKEGTKETDASAFEGILVDEYKKLVAALKAYNEIFTPAYNCLNDPRFVELQKKAEAAKAGAL